MRIVRTAAAALAAVPAQARTGDIRASSTVAISLQEGTPEIPDGTPTPMALLA